MFSSLLFGIFLVAEAPKQFTMEDMLNFKCNNGNQSACSQLEQIQLEKKDAEFLQTKVDGFAEKLANMKLMLDEKRPDLEAAYPLVMYDYFQGLEELGKAETLIGGARMESCASHYHNHWINKKLWWPNDEGKPDWADIYVFIVDHYYGYCLKAG